MRRAGASNTAKAIAVVVALVVVAAAVYAALAFGPQTQTGSSPSGGTTSQTSTSTSTQTAITLSLNVPVTLTIYGTVDTTDMQTLIKDFQGNYSWIAVNYVQLTPPAALTRIKSEQAGNKSTADMVFITNSVINVMKSGGMLTSYNSSQVSNYPAGYYDPAGNWAAAILLPVVFSYNTQALSTATLPTFLGLTDPSWANKVTILNPSLGSTGTQYLLSLVPVVGNQTWTNWVAQLETNVKPSSNSDTTAIAHNVASGQFQVGVFTYLHDVIRLRSEGANINWFLPKLSNGSSIPLLTALQSVAILKGTPHMQAAQLFENFVLSKAGQLIIGNSAVRIPAMPGLSTPYSLDKVAPNANIVFFPTPAVSASASAWGTRFRALGY